jgi:hypothetical protein
MRFGLYAAVWLAMSAIHLCGAHAQSVDAPPVAPDRQLFAIEIAVGAKWDAFNVFYPGEVTSRPRR